jgi:hypothetical protein
MKIGIESAVALFLSMPFGLVLGQPLGRDEHKELHWKAADGCVVNFADTPCRTVRYHEYSFGRRLGFDGTTRSECIEAFDQTGSQARTIARTWRRWWPLPEQTSKRTELVLRTEDQIVYIDHERRVYEAHRGGAQRNWPYWEEDDGQCSHTATHHTYLTGRLPDTVMAGVHVVGYGGRDFRGVDYEIYFAPSIGCQEMKFQMVMRGLFSWITAEYDMVVDSYALGPPAQSLFAVPTGYRQVPSILQSQSEQAIMP